MDYIILIVSLLLLYMLWYNKENYLSQYGNYQVCRCAGYKESGLSDIKDY